MLISYWLITRPFFTSPQSSTGIYFILHKFPGTVKPQLQIKPLQGFNKEIKVSRVILFIVINIIIILLSNTPNSTMNLVSSILFNILNILMQVVKVLNQIFINIL